MWRLFQAFQTGSNNDNGRLTNTNWDSANWEGLNQQNLCEWLWFSCRNNHKVMLNLAFGKLANGLCQLKTAQPSSILPIDHVAKKTLIWSLWSHTFWTSFLWLSMVAIALLLTGPDYPLAIWSAKTNEKRKWSFNRFGHPKVSVESPYSFCRFVDL